MLRYVFKVQYKMVVQAVFTSEDMHTEKYGIFRDIGKLLVFLHSCIMFGGSL